MNNSTLCQCPVVIVKSLDKEPEVTEISFHSQITQLTYVMESAADGNVCHNVVHFTMFLLRKIFCFILL